MNCNTNMSSFSSLAEAIDTGYDPDDKSIYLDLANAAFSDLARDCCRACLVW